MQINEYEIMKHFEKMDLHMYNIRIMIEKLEKDIEELKEQVDNL